MSHARQRTRGEAAPERRKARRRLLTILGAVAATGAAVAMLAATAPREQQRPTASADIAAQRAAAAANVRIVNVFPTAEQRSSSAPTQKVVVDAITGELRAPTAEESAALGGAAASGANVGEPFVATDGSLGVIVPDDLAMASVAVLGADGSVAVQEVQGTKAASQLPRSSTQAMKEVR